MKHTAQEKLNLITKALANKKTVYVQTELHTTRVTPSTLKKWESQGLKLFKVFQNSLYIARGKNFDCIDFAALTTSN